MYTYTIFECMIISAFICIGIFFALFIASMLLTPSRLKVQLPDLGIVIMGFGLILGGIGLIGASFTESDTGMKILMGFFGTGYGLKLLWMSYDHSRQMMDLETRSRESESNFRQAQERRKQEEELRKQAEELRKQKKNPPKDGSA